MTGNQELYSFAIKQRKLSEEGNGMNDNLYTVRDLLAFDRTYLANERTLLAYVRTFVGLMASGAALLKLFEVTWAHAAALGLLLFAPIILVLGIVRFITIDRRLKNYSASDFSKAERS